jgi:hypothetical protein
MTRERPEPRSVFTLKVEASIRQLRWWMKRAGRGYGVRVIDAREAENQACNASLKPRGRP